MVNQASSLLRIMDIPLPPALLRQGGEHFLDDEDFVQSAVTDVEKLSSVGLQPHSRVVDLGCGPGRLAFGLIKVGWFEGSYLGLEVQKQHVEWCTDHITSQEPQYRFQWLDASNERYNPDGMPSRRLPVADETVDIFYAYSVFTHMRGPNVIDYFREVKRILRPDGRAFATVFCDSGVPDETENPDWWGDMEWRGPLHCVLYSIDWLERQIDLAGLRFVDFRKGAEYDRQTAVVLKPT